ncbi:UDP-2,3-diacylglucosamine diphosphatase [Ravibacter arvi]|uniref:UDP-2,3-diacylglucosamine diphosphatase n=1 Tax=Ravibacter arvi TaxID=2051041 RepID=A0ABP8LSP1_9BACT
MSDFRHIDLNLPAGKSIFFVSDFHLGASAKGDKNRDLEKRIVDWLRRIAPDAAYLFLVGDVFDYWFEYKHVVPKGAVRLLGQLAEIADTGIPIYYFTGNHDMWVRDYFEQELGAIVSRDPMRFTVTTSGPTSRLFVGHGDGLGPGDHFYKFLKVLFESSLARTLFRQVHPDLATKLAFAWSKQSRAANNEKGEDTFKGLDREWLYQYCLEVEQQLHHDYYVFGHRHLPLDLQVGENSRYINLGEWFSRGSGYPYARFDGRSMELKYDKSGTGR